MILPASKYAAPKRVLIYEGDELIFDFVCKIDNLTPDFTAYVDLSLFFGKESFCSSIMSAHASPMKSSGASAKREQGIFVPQKGKESSA